MENILFLIPSGTKNLESIFPNLSFGSMSEYYLTIQDSEANVIATTPKFKVCNCFPEGGIRIHFLNYCGTFDAQNFPKPTVIHEDESEVYRRGLQYPLIKTDASFERFNVSSNDTYSVKLHCNEPDMPFLQELADSPKLFLEWDGIEGQSDSYMPLIKTDGKFEKLKNNNEFTYEFILEFRLANEFHSLRN